MSDYNSTMTIMHAPIAALSLATLYHGHPCPSFWLWPELPLRTARLSLRQEGQTRVEALVEGGPDPRSSLTGGFCAGMFGAVFNTPGDVIRSTIQKRALAEMTLNKVPFSAELMFGGVKSRSSSRSAPRSPRPRA